MPSVSEIGILAPGAVRASAIPRRWRRRGSFTALDDLDDIDLLARAFHASTQDLARAPLHYLGMTGEHPDGYCLFAYPVYLHARREQLILMAGPDFDPTEEEAESLVEALREHFPEWRIERTRDAMWFIMLEQDPHLETTPLQEVLGENINDHLPRGGDAMDWHRILNELQMLLFDSEVNREREASGRPPINSLWFWGGGRLSEQADSIARRAPWRRLVTDNPVALGLGRLAGMETQWLDTGNDGQVPLDIDAAEPGTLFVLSDAAGFGDRPGSSGQWRSVRAMLRRGEVDRVMLIEPAYGELIIDARAALSWWPW